MDLKFVITIAALAASVNGVPVPPNSPKYVPVFVSSDALNSLNEKDGQNGNKPVPISESGQDLSSQGPNSDYDIKKEIQQIFKGPPAAVYEHQPSQNDASSPQYQTQQAQQQYQNQQPGQLQQQYQPNQQPGQLQQQYQPNQQPGQLQQQYQPNQQPGQLQQQYQPNQQPAQLSYQQPIQPSYQISPQPSQIQQYQISQPGQSQLYQMQETGQMQPIAVAQQSPQPIYGNQQQILASQQPIGQQSVINQQPMLYNQQQLVPQPVQAYQQPHQLLITSLPAGNQQTISTQSQPILLNQQAPLPNQQAILLQQPNQNGQATFITSNPVNIGQPNQVNPGYIPNQNQNVFTMVPLNQNVAPNQNVGTNTYLVPVQQLPNTVQQAPNLYAVNSG